MDWRARIKGWHMMTVGGALYGVWLVMLLTGAEHAGVVSSSAFVWLFFGYLRRCDEKKRAARRDKRS